MIYPPRFYCLKKIIKKKLEKKESKERKRKLGDISIRKEKGNGFFGKKKGVPTENLE